MVAVRNLPQQQEPATAPPSPFAAWLADEMRDRNCTNGRRSDLVEFARQYGFALSTVSAWLSGRRVPGMQMCRVIADNLDLMVLEVVCAAGHLCWSDIDDYNRAYHDHEVDADTAWAMMGE